MAAKRSNADIALASEATAPKKKVATPWWDDACKAAVIFRKKAFTRAKISNNVKDIMLYKQAQLAVKKAITEAKRKYSANTGNQTQVEENEDQGDLTVDQVGEASGEGAEPEDTPAQEDAVQVVPTATAVLETTPAPADPSPSTPAPQLEPETTPETVSTATATAPESRVAGAVEDQSEGQSEEAPAVTTAKCEKSGDAKSNKEKCVKKLKTQDYSLPFNPNNPVGMEFLTTMSGFFCLGCNRFFTGDKEVQNTHCKTLKHYKNLEKYLESRKTKAKPTVKPASS